VSVAQVRGGVPWVWRETVTDTGWAVRVPFQTNYMHIETATVAVKAYFTLADFVNDQDYIYIPPAFGPYPWKFQGPVELHPVQLTVWLRSVGGKFGGPTETTVVAHQGRG
jgi:hypothetical protein